MNVSELRVTLLENTSKDFLIEILNNANLANPVRALAFMAVQTASEKDVIKFSRVAAIALQYIEQKDTPGLERLIISQGIPQPLVNLIMSYVANITINQ